MAFVVPLLGVFTVSVCMDICIACFEFLNSNRILKIQIKWWGYSHLNFLKLIFILCV